MRTLLEDLVEGFGSARFDQGYAEAENSPNNETESFRSEAATFHADILLELDDIRSQLLKLVSVLSDQTQREEFCRQLDRLPRVPR